MPGGDRREARLCREWLQERKDALAQEREMAARAAEAARPVGPTKPGTAADGDAEGGGYGGNLQPGEGERCASSRCVLAALHIYSHGTSL